MEGALCFRPVAAAVFSVTEVEPLPNLVIITYDEFRLAYPGEVPVLVSDVRAQLRALSYAIDCAMTKRVIRQHLELLKEKGRQAYGIPPRSGDESAGRGEVLDCLESAGEAGTGAETSHGGRSDR